MLLCAALANLTASAQVQQAEKSMSKGLRTALVLNIPDVDNKNVGKLWQDFLKDNYKGKTKWDRKTSEWVTLAADIPAIGMGKNADLYARTEALGSTGTTLSVWIDLGDAFLNAANNPERYAEAEKILDRFALVALKFKIGEEAAAQEKELKNLEGNLKKLEKDKERAQKDIEKARELIRKAEEEIVKNEDDQKEATIKIETQRRLLEDTRRRLESL